jgi:hypothetical protein
LIYGQRGCERLPFYDWLTLISEEGMPQVL